MNRIETSSRIDPTMPENGEVVRESRWSSYNQRSNNLFGNNVKKLIFVLSLSLCSVFAAAQDNVQNLQQAVAKVKKDTGGQVLSTTEKNVDGQRVFRIKVLDKKGVVRYIEVKTKP